MPFGQSASIRIQADLRGSRERCFAGGRVAPLSMCRMYAPVASEYATYLPSGEITAPVTRYCSVTESTAIAASHPLMQLVKLVHLFPSCSPWDEVISSL